MKKDKMKTSNKLLFGLFIAILVVITITAVFISRNLKFGPSVNGSGVALSENRQLQPFNQLEATSGIQVIYTPGSGPKVSVKGDSNLVKQLVTEVTNGKLSIRLDVKSFRTNIPLIVEITTDSLTQVSIGAGCDFTVHGTMKQNTLTLDAGSGSSADITGEFGRFAADMSSGSSAKFAGKTAQAKIGASSGAEVKAASFICGIASIEASSGASVNINVTGELSVDASSGSVIKYAGNPNMKSINISSGATLSK
jgi:hypothetical protein